MHVGDRIRLASSPACATLGVARGQIGVIKDIDVTRCRTTVLISFPDVDVYTSALGEDDIEVVADATELAARRPDAPKPIR